MATDNQEQIEYWNGKAGATWVEANERLDRLLAPISDIALTFAGVRAGERAIDVGCGCGATSIALAEQGAQVWGVDVSEPMIGYARSRAQAAGVDVAFSVADASTADYTPDHNLVFSRFGVMFFADPAAAFANIRSALCIGGRLCFVCWQAPRQNPWMSIAGAAVQPFLPQPETPPDPRAPGPFAFADKGYLRSILQIAGFSGIRIEPISPTLHLADDVDEAMRFQAEVGPLARALAELEGEQRDVALAAAREALSAQMGPDGLRLGSACWLVTARR